VSKLWRRLTGALASRGAKRAGLSLATVLFCFLLAEIGLRLFDPLGIDYIQEHERLLKKMPRHPLYAYLMPPNLSEVFQGVRIETNSEGLRGPEFSLVKKAGVKRILLVGDSVVLGWGVAQQQTLSAVLERLLNDSRTGSRFEVIGVAALSWNTRNQAEFLKDRARLYDADAIVLVVVSNDIVPKPIGKTFVAKEILTPTTPEYGPLNTARLWLARRSYVVALVHRLILIQELRGQFAEDFREGSPEREDAAQAFDEIVGFARSADIPMIGYLYFLFEERTSPVGRLYEEFYGGLFSKHGLGYSTFPTEIYQTQYRNSVIDPHQNARGLDIMARHIYSTLGEIGQ
jgi:hypothetical protein